MKTSRAQSPKGSERSWRCERHNTQHTPGCHAPQFHSHLLFHTMHSRQARLLQLIHERSEALAIGAYGAEAIGKIELA